MKLYEFQAKQIFKKEGIPIPRGEVASSPDEVEKIANNLGGSVVIKSQVLVGGRGLAGGIKFVDNPKQAKSEAESLFGSEIKGNKIHRLLVEEKVDIAQELYLGILIDQDRREPLIMISPAGGVEIEVIAEESPEKIIQQHGSIYRGLGDFTARSLAKKAGIKPALVRSFSKLLHQLYTVFEKYDTSLVEINPLVQTSNGEFIAVDAKLTIDPRAAFRHREIATECSDLVVRPESGTPLRKYQATEMGLSAYFELDGNIGIITDGAGTGMLTFDLVHDFNGKAANFCELGGDTNPELMNNSLKLVTSNPNVETVLVNLIGGLNLMDEMAEGIVKFSEETKTNIPLVIRMTGTQEEEGRAMLDKAGIEWFDNIYDSVEKAVSVVRRQ